MVLILYLVIVEKFLNVAAFVNQRAAGRIVVSLFEIMVKDIHVCALLGIWLTSDVGVVKRRDNVFHRHGA